MFKLAMPLIKSLGAAAAVGLGAKLAAPSQGGRKRRTRGGCTPCAAMANVEAARKRVRDGRL